MGPRLKTIVEYAAYEKFATLRNKGPLVMQAGLRSQGLSALPCEPPLSGFLPDSYLNSPDQFRGIGCGATQIHRADTSEPEPPAT
jgi:hypothetical protein